MVIITDPDQGRLIGGGGKWDLSEDAWQAEAPMEKIAKRRPQQQEAQGSRSAYAGRIATGQPPDLNNLLSYSKKYGPDARRSRYEGENTTDAWGQGDDDDNY